MAARQHCSVALPHSPHYLSVLLSDLVPVPIRWDKQGPAVLVLLLLVLLINVSSSDQDEASSKSEGEPLPEPGSDSKPSVAVCAAAPQAGRPGFLERLCSSSNRSLFRAGLGPV